MTADPSRCLTLFSDYLTDAVKEASVARSEGTLVVDHLHLEDEGRFHQSVAHSVKTGHVFFFFFGRAS